MLFNSVIFLFVFLPIAYVVFWQLRNTQQRHIWLTITGYVFYGYWDPRFCLLMAFTTMTSYLAGLGFLRATTAGQRHMLLVLPITVDLMMLGFFKYAGFTARSLNELLQVIGVNASIPVLDVVLPIGISFYTFHTISYIVDSYRGVIRPTRSLFEFTAYVSLFSQLVAGPIVRFRQIEKDLEQLGSAVRARSLPIGISFLVFGLAEKVLVADSLAHFVDPWLASFNSLSSAGAWLAMLGYSLQLYFDFCGYSSMAVGLGLMFGLRIPMNFNSPYRSLNPSEFWRRWHISLSSCLRDYLYISMGGNKKGEAATLRNLMLTMLIGGLWHGANWTFVLWGFYHGLLLIIYRLTASRWDALPVAVARVLMLTLVIVGWVLFRATDMHMVGALLTKMFIPTSGSLGEGAVTFAVLIALAGFWSIRGNNVFEFHQKFEWTLPRQMGTAFALGASVAMIMGSRSSPFLYFQF